MGDRFAEIIGIDELKDSRVWRAFLAEFIGTFLMVLIGVAAVIQDMTQILLVGETQTADVAPITRIAFAFGFTVASVLKAFEHVSGGHINPAITLSFIISGHIRILKALIYMILQFTAAIAASFVLKFIKPELATMKRGLTQINSNIDVTTGFLLETFLTFMVVLNAQGFYDPGRTDIKGSAPLGIGLAVVAAHMCGVEWTGCGINPARTLGPAIVEMNFKNIWVFFVGPFLGAIVASIFYRFVLKAPTEEE